MSELRPLGLSDFFRMTAGNGFTCTACGKVIEAEQTHYVWPGPDRFFCGACVTSKKSTSPLHAQLFPNCDLMWHDIWDHPVSMCEDRRCAEFVARQLGSVVKHVDYLQTVQFPEKVTARVVIQAGLCSPQCILATDDDRLDDCKCRCGGEWHGRLADAEVDPWYSPIQRKPVDGGTHTRQE